MSLAALIEIKLVGTFALFLGALVWQLVSVRRALRRDRETVEDRRVDALDGTARRSSPPPRRPARRSPE